MDKKTFFLSRKRILALAAIALAFTIAAILHSLLRGRLLAPPTEDDAAYMADGARRLIQLYDESTLGFLRGLAADLPHSPLSMAFAMLGFAFFGMREFAPYVVNGLLIFALLAFASRFTQKLPRWLDVLALATVLTAPLALAAVSDFRPDAALAIVLAIGVFLIVEKGRDSSIGICFAIALLAKPSAFPFTLMIYGLTHLLSAPHQRQSLVSRTSWMVILAAPYYVLGGKHAFDYFSYFIFTDAGKIWSPNAMTLSEHALYYLTGYAGRWALGGHVYFSLAIIAFGEIRMFLKTRSLTRTPYHTFLAVCFFSWLVVTVSSSKSLHFGLPFQVMLLIGAVWQVERIWQDRSRRASGVHCAWSPVFFAFGMICFLIGSARSPFWHETPRSIPAALDRDLSTRVFQDIVSHKPRWADRNTPALTYITVAGIPRTPRMKWFATIHQEPLLFASRNLEGDTKVVLDFIAESPFFVLAADASARGVLGFMNNAKIADEVLAAMKKNPAFSLIAQYPDGNGKAYYLFQRKN